MANVKINSPGPQPESGGLSLGTLLSFIFFAVLIVSAFYFIRERNRGPVADPPGAKSRENLALISKAILVYVNDNHGSLPDTFADLLKLPGVSPEIFICPDTSDTPATGPSTQATVENFATPGHCSFAYLGKGLTAKTLDSTMILACEPMSNHNGAGINVLFGNGKVEFEKPSIAAVILDQVNKGTWPVRYPAR